MGGALYRAVTVYTNEVSAVIRLPKLLDLAALVSALEKNPFGSVVLLNIIGMALIAWLGR